MFAFAVLVLMSDANEFRGQATEGRSSGKLRPQVRNGFHFWRSRLFIVVLVAIQFTWFVLRPFTYRFGASSIIEQADAATSIAYRGNTSIVLVPTPSVNVKRARVSDVARL